MQRSFEKIPMDLHGGEHNIILDGLIQQKADAASVLRDKGKPGLESRCCIIERQFLAKQLDITDCII